jgi:heptosyltransferase I
MRDPSLNRIAIVMMSAIGDAVHVLPVINAIKRHAPHSHVTWILDPRPASLVRGHPAVDEIIEFDRRRGFRSWLELRRTLRDRAFDLVMDLQVAIKAGVVTSFLNSRRKLGFDRRRARDLNWLFTNERIPPHANQHVLDQYFEFLDHLGVPHGEPEWNLGPWASERDWARRLVPATMPVASIGVATSRADRDWPAERWAQVIDVLYEKYGVQSMLVGGRSVRELEAERIIMQRVRHKPLSTLGCSLRELVSVIDASALVLTGDTAPSHIGSALGKPVIGLFGQTDPRRTGPYRGPRDLLIDAFQAERDPGAVSMPRSSRMNTITVDDVLAKIDLWHRSYR